MNSAAMTSLRGCAAKATAAAAAMERAIKSEEAALLGARAYKSITVAITTVERGLNAIGAVILREHIMKAITVTLALLIIAIALPAIY